MTGKSSYMTEEFTADQKAEMFFSGLVQLLYDYDVLWVNADPEGIMIAIGDSQIVRQFYETADQLNQRDVT